MSDSSHGAKSYIEVALDGFHDSVDSLDQAHGLVQGVNQLIPVDLSKNTKNQYFVLFPAHALRLLFAIAEAAQEQPQVFLGVVFRNQLLDLLHSLDKAEQVQILLHKLHDEKHTDTLKLAPPSLLSGRGLTRPK